jgi:Ala-tRNA(Pro) deacylase
MAIAQSLERYMSRQGVTYDLTTHDKTGCSAATARAGAIPAQSLAKGVLVKRRNGYVLAIVPASCQVQLNALGGVIGQPVGLATQEEVAEVFNDCEPGSVPPVAGAYGLAAVLDERLEDAEDIYFEAGDHCTLVHVMAGEFERLMTGVPHASIGVPKH